MGEIKAYSASDLMSMLRDPEESGQIIDLLDNDEGVKNILALCIQSVRFTNVDDNDKAPCVYATVYIGIMPWIIEYTRCLGITYTRLYNYALFKSLLRLIN